MSARRSRDSIPVSQLGFTVVELVVVIILLGTLSAVAISVSVSPSSFAPSLAAQFFSQQIQRAQTLARQRQDSDVVVVLTSVADGWRTQTTVGGAVYREELLDVSALTVRTTPPGGSVTPITSLQLGLTGLGRLANAQLNGIAVDHSEGFEVTVVGESERLVCIYPTGYVDARACR